MTDDAPGRRIYDITLPLHTRLAGWPGDTLFDFHLAWQQSAGASVNVGALTMSVHTGTHADAPFHFDAEGATVDALPLDAFLGPARVLDVRAAIVSRGPGARLTAADLAPAGPDLAHAPRLLLRTDAWTDHTRFPEAVPTLAEDAVALLSAQGVRLVGVDLPSVDALDSTTLPVHRALHRAGIQILENLDLRNVPAGRYELIALPLKLAGADGAPVRAVLREER